MSNILQIVITSCLTVITGVVVFALGQFSVSLFVEPISKLKSLINDIDDSLNYFSDVYQNVEYSQVSKRNEALEKLKYQSSQLKSMCNCIPWYPLWGYLRIIPPKLDVLKGAKFLSLIVNNINNNQNTDLALIKDLRQLLDINLDVNEQ